MARIEPVEAYIIMEEVSEPMKPKNLVTVCEPNLFYARFTTCLQSFDVFNRNGRNYKKAAMTEGLAADHIKELISKGDWKGENSHPDSEDPKRVLQIDLKNVSHRIIDYSIRGNLLYGTVETLNDDMWGKQFTKHILQGCEPSFSLRALAAVTKIDGGRGIVARKPFVVAYDRVIFPSHKEAYRDTTTKVDLVKESTNVMKESKDASFILTESSALDYVLNESKKVKTMIDYYSIQFESVSFTSDINALIVRDPSSNRTYQISLEGYISHQIKKTFSALKG